MTKIRIELVNGSITEFGNTHKTFSELCREIVKAPFYVVRPDDEVGNVMIARDHIVRITRI
jgi:hypothetical protein